MNPRDLLKKIGSVAAATAVIAGPTYGAESKQDGLAVSEGVGHTKGGIGAPMVMLEAPAALLRPVFAGHGSHSSHASHYSHRSGSGGGGGGGSVGESPVVASSLPKAKAVVVKNGDGGGGAPAVANLLPKAKAGVVKKRMFRSPITGAIDATNVATGARVGRVSAGSVLKVGYVIHSIRLSYGMPKKVSTWLDIATFVAKIPNSGYEVAGFDSGGHRFEALVQPSLNLPGVIDSEDVDAGARIKHCIGDTNLRDGWIIQSINVVGHPAQTVQKWAQIREFVGKNLDKDLAVSGIDSEGNRFSAYIPFSALKAAP